MKLLEICVSDDYLEYGPKSWRPPSIVLEADPPLHTRTRKVLARIMSPGAMRKLEDAFKAKALALVDDLVEKRSFDAIRDLAEVFPLTVFPDSVTCIRSGESVVQRP